MPQKADERKLAERPLPANKSAERVPESRRRSSAEPDSLPWLSSLSEGYRRALADRKPMLVRVGAKWCAPCRTLAAELTAPAVQAELARWTLVYLDLDDQSGDAEDLGVTGVPALRLRTASGQPVADRDGYLGPDELVAWLKKHYDDATAAADEALVGSGEPERHGGRAAGAAVPAAQPGAARGGHPASGGLSRRCPAGRGEGVPRRAWRRAWRHWRSWSNGRRRWRAWTPGSRKPSPSGSRGWSDGWRTRPSSAGSAAPLTAEQLASARRQIERMFKAETEPEADAIRQRLAGLGPAAAAGGLRPAEGRRHRPGPPPAVGAAVSAGGRRRAGVALAGRDRAAGRRRPAAAASRPPTSWRSWPAATISRCCWSCSPTPIRWCARSASAACSTSAASRPTPRWSSCWPIRSRTSAPPC